jgi:hypothetical protein
MTAWKVFQKPGMLVGIPDFADPSILGDTLRQSGFGWCAVKVLQGTNQDNYSIDWLVNTKWPEALRLRGITFGLWGYHENNPAAEAQLASDLITKFDDANHSCFYIADCEAEYTSWGGDVTRSAQFVSAFRKFRPTRPAAMTSYGGATLDNNLSTVFDYKPWQQNSFDFFPQTYFQQAPELEPAHCLEQAVAAGWTIDVIHPLVGVYHDTLGRITGAQNAYLIRNCRKRFNISGYSVFDAENMTIEDYKAFKEILG